MQIDDSTGFVQFRCHQYTFFENAGLDVLLL
jgi:hypothetical protein